MSPDKNTDPEVKFEVATPPSSVETPTATPSKKKRAAPQAKPGADGTADSSGNTASAAEVRLLIEMMTSACEQTGVKIKFDWAAICEKLSLPSAAATNKRAERLLNRFDLKMSDITRCPKKEEGEGTPGGSKRKDVGGPESPTKRPAGARGKAKVKAEKQAEEEDAA